MDECNTSAYSLESHDHDWEREWNQKRVVTATTPDPDSATATHADVNSTAITCAWTSDCTPNAEWRDYDANLRCRQRPSSRVTDRHGPARGEDLDVDSIIR